MSLEKLHKLSFKNRKILKRHDKVSCFYCLNTNHVISIKEFADTGQTALCPDCGIDSLVPERELKIGDLGALHQKYFNLEAEPSDLP